MSNVDMQTALPPDCKIEPSKLWTRDAVDCEVIIDEHSKENPSDSKTIQKILATAARYM